MEWTDDDQLELADLAAPVRRKALEIAEELIEEKQMTRKEAIREGIRLAEEWFQNLQA